jgi:CheY-like chemotaxis protein
MSDNSNFILLAEDDSVVAELIMHGLAQTKQAPHVIHVRDGEDALNFLRSTGRHEHREPGDPAVVLLDVKMPKLDGLEVLRQLKTDERLRMLPVVMLTSSQDERDVHGAYELGANAYVVKPLEFRRFMAVLQELASFWLTINLPPPLPRSYSITAGLAHESRDDFGDKH